MSQNGQRSRWKNLSVIVREVIANAVDAVTRSGVSKGSGNTLGTERKNKRDRKKMPGQKKNAERVFYGLSRVYRFTPGKKLKRLQSHGCLKCLRMDKEADERIYRSRHIGMENPFERIRMCWDESKYNHTLIVCIIINDTHNNQSQSRINQSNTYPLRLQYKCYSI